MSDVMSDNPFLIPPHARPRPIDLRAATAPVPTVPVRHPDHYIAVPPSVESATHRIVRDEPAPELATETRIVAGVVPAGPWGVALPDGSRLAVDRPTLIGRDPAPGAVDIGSDLTLVPLDDPTKTVSKTHALLEPGDGGIRVVDVHSTNGVTIRIGSECTVLAAGGEGFAPPLAVIELGSCALTVVAGER